MKSGVFDEEDPQNKSVQGKSTQPNSRKYIVPVVTVTTLLLGFVAVSTYNNGIDFTRRSLTESSIQKYSEKWYELERQKNAEARKDKSFATKSFSQLFGSMSWFHAPFTQTEQAHVVNALTRAEAPRTQPIVVDENNPDHPSQVMMRDDRTGFIVTPKKIDFSIFKNGTIEPDTPLPLVVKPGCATFTYHVTADPRPTRFFTVCQVGKLTYLTPEIFEAFDILKDGKSQLSEVILGERTKVRIFKEGDFTGPTFTYQRRKEVKFYPPLTGIKLTYMHGYSELANDNIKSAIFWADPPLEDALAMCPGILWPETNLTESPPESGCALLSYHVFADPRLQKLAMTVCAFPKKDESVKIIKIWPKRLEGYGLIVDGQSKISDVVLGQRTRMKLFRNPDHTGPSFTMIRGYAPKQYPPLSTVVYNNGELINDNIYSVIFESRWTDYDILPNDCPPNAPKL